ncbi:SusD/RagB family nutrient-binding outer membrane lipoprotein [Arachidicoccus terrestris]|uniref:SusD/RagB family nutrient-binding outer membrane lipoprotein n=1 Tax=Arachidicoccus terrestris TaxID=2875539 RepID=UPI001CC74B82|nr:SusD/RagB family nutrient-binding outer membrane lipoprotein [Arachidicoccus terrestris]UAY57179.1 SusD/RagB family nutrient-binding outer membrane lipoprotein [Arachidicoccus terrestris]
MKRILYITILSCALMFGMTSCQKYLNINDNPNSATNSTPELMLSQALTSTGAVVNTYNTMGAQLVGYMANAGGYGGFGPAVTYSFGNGNFQGCWNDAYNNLTDYQWIITHTNGDLSYAYYNGAAKIMKALVFQLLVDTYNNVPYTDAFKEKENLTPKYDDAKVVYDSIYALLDGAIASINEGQHDLETNGSSNVQEFGDNDVLFGGDMDDWKKLANTLKLRIALRSKGTLTFNNNYDAVGFLDKDAMVNPGYQQADGKQNPLYNSWGYTYTGSTANRAWMTCTFVSAFYDGNKLDDYRGYAIFNNFGGSSYGINQLGYESNSVPSAPSAGSWITPYQDKNNNIGVLKGPGASMPILTLAEADFMQAEAALVGGLGVSGDVKTYFDAGVLDSYKYIYRLSDGNYDLTNWNPETDYQAYLDMNPDSYLVHIDLAENNAQKLEAIITQKYIALNMVNSDQSWNDFRRTGYPKIVNGSSNGVLTFASLQSTSSRTDKLPSRILYPTSELSYNNENVPKDINQFTSRIFWDPE